MILFNIIQKEDTTAEAISTYLIENNYAVQTHIDKNEILTLHGKKETIRLFFITKALLYNKIETEITSHFPSKDLVIYATPISHVNKELYESIIEHIKSV